CKHAAHRYIRWKTLALLFFFSSRRRHTRSDRDWSSDVCSSDLLDTVGCGIRSRRSISPTDCWDRTRRLRIARRFGSAMMANADRSEERRVGKECRSRWRTELENERVNMIEVTAGEQAAQSSNTR